MNSDSMLIRKNNTGIIIIPLFFVLVIFGGMLFAMVLFSGMSLEQIFQRFFIEKFPIMFGSGELYKASIFENIEKPQKIEIKNIATVLYTKSFDEIDYLYFYNKERTLVLIINSVALYKNKDIEKLLIYLNNENKRIQFEDCEKFIVNG
ncbi:hypothetical protein J4450_02640 [Candidatus Micrarchaeota archaeon]|nr:hypothetical protein [Candidatus Micrarchaeota archaeon]